MTTFSYEYRPGLRLDADSEEEIDLPEKGLTKEVSFQVYARVNGADGEIYIARFKFSPMPGCCGVVVSHNTFVEKEHRGTVFSTHFRSLKYKVAKDLGYGAMIATTRMDDIPAVKNMFKSNYRIETVFINPRTGNPVGIGTKKI